MQAIVKLGDGKYYVSTVFGYYDNVKSKDDYQRYLERIHTPYFIVWDERKEHLIKQLKMQPNTTNMILQVLIVDCNQDNWIVDDNGIGGVDFLPRALADKLTNEGIIPHEISEKCHALDERYHYEPYQKVENDIDIDNLYCVSGYFHDACIKEQRVEDDETLYVLFDGMWGCNIEMWFSGNIEFSTDSRDPEFYDPFWFGATVILEDGFVYLIDEEDVTVDDIGPNYCWFKANHLKYRVIPD